MRQMFFALSLRGFQQTSPKGPRAAKPFSAAQALRRFLEFMQLLSSGGKNRGDKGPYGPSPLSEEQALL